jgi:hypothetical protein
MEEEADENSRQQPENEFQLRQRRDGQKRKEPGRIDYETIDDLVAFLRYITDLEQ